MTHLTDCYCDIFAYVLALVEAPGPGLGCEKAREDLLALFAAAQTRAAEAGFDAADVRDAAFAVCAFTDETLLRSAWDGAKRWQTAQLQQHFFNTHNAGVEFYDRLGALTATDAPARETFALCLGLGYQGKFFAEGQSRELHALRRNAVRAVLGEDGPAHGTFDQPLFPEAYQAPQARGKRFNPWAFDWWLFCFLILSGVIAAQVYLFLRNDLNIQLLDFFGSLS